MPKVIVNSTPIISLCLIEKLHLLKDLYGSIVIPEAVYKEIYNGSKKCDKFLKNEV